MEARGDGAVDEDGLDLSVTEQREKRRARWLPSVSFCIPHAGKFAT